MAMPQPPTTHELLSLGNALKKCGLELYLEPLSAVLPWLTTEERSLFIDLVGRFSVCEFNEYLGKSVSLVGEFMGRLDASTNQVVLLPLLDPTNQQKPKSGEAVAWVMSREIETRVKESGRNFKMVSGALDLNLLQPVSESIFLLVDDFVGSGGTAEKALKWLSSSGVPCNRMLVGCFVGLRAGLEKILSTGADAIFLETIDRGISDAAHILDKSAALQVMESVEKKNKVSKSYRFGYEASEALALMCFCPNNTFPVFWWDGPNWKGPFSR